MKTNELANQKLLRATEVAEILDISRAMAYRLMQQGKIRMVRISGSRRVRAEDLETYISDNVYPLISKASTSCIPFIGKSSEVKFGYFHGTLPTEY